MLKLINRIVGRMLKSRKLTGALSPDAIELRLENKLIYILHLLGTHARTKTARKSLPADQQFVQNYNGWITNKTICGWEQHFIRNATGLILNHDIRKMRFYIDIELTKQEDQFFTKGDIRIALNYYVH